MKLKCETELPKYLVGAGTVCKDGKVIGRFLTSRDMRDIHVGSIYEIGVFPECEESYKTLDEANASVELRVGIPDSEDIMVYSGFCEEFGYLREGSKVSKELVVKGVSVGKIGEGKFRVFGWEIRDKEGCK